jgi:dipeptide/tripeptide permease
MGHKIPKSAYFLGIYQLFERYATSGISGLMAIFFYKRLDYPEHLSTAFVHYFYFTKNITAIIGLIIADSCLGKFKTLLYFTILYIFGIAIIGVGTVHDLNLPVRTFSFIGLFIIVIVSSPTDCIIRSYGGDQYKLPEQTKALAFYFSISYFMLNVGSAVARLLNPLMRENISCFGGECYALIFSIAALLLVVGTLTLLCGKQYSICIKPQENMLAKVCGCIWVNYFYYLII